MLIQQHGADAPVHAAMRAEDMLVRGNVDGGAVWLRVKRAAETLLSEAGSVH